MKKTTKTKYFYNEDEHICRSVTTETSDYCDCGDCEVETGVELDSVIEMSPLEILLTATVDALLGNLLYHVVRKD